MDYSGRLRRLRGRLAACRLDALIVTHLPNIRYLCGFSGSSAALVIKDDRAMLFTDGRYRAQAREEAKGVRTTISSKTPVVAAADWLAANRKYFGRGKVWLGIEGENLTVGLQQRLRAALPSALRLKLSPPLVENLRMVKDKVEIEHMKAAIDLGAGLFNTALGTIRPGVSEIAVAGEMELAARKGGAQGMSFEPIVASGVRSALPHGRASRKAIPSAGFVVCDFGVILAGYCSDRTRTIHVGRASSMAREVYQAVLDAQRAAINTVRAGRSCGEVDHAARTLLKKRKLHRFFTHSTGHGLGLEIHEAPRVAAGQAQILEPGMVITIEPGVYIPGQWGVRIEDVVVVTGNGCEVLAPNQKEMIQL